MVETLTRLSKLDDVTFEEAINNCSHTVYHPVGTCRIADASVMPTIIRGHTHAPILLAAARGNPAAHKGFELRRKRIGRQQLRKQFGLGHLGAEHQVDRDVMIGAVLD